MTTTGRWVGQISAAGSDSRLGWWTWQTLQGDTNLTVITAYCVCQESGNSGEQMVHAQQRALLLSTTSQPDPPQQILHDLKNFIQLCQDKGETVILLIDGNEDILSDKFTSSSPWGGVSTNLHPRSGPN